MLIVSQDKTIIINFNKIQQIYVSDKYISAIYELHDSEVIGTYKTEKRAKEVLQEIIARYEHTQYIKGFGREIDCYEVGIKNFAYEMPKE